MPVYKTLEERISGLTTQLIVEHPFFGMFLSSTNIFKETSIKTAATDGLHIYYNPKFIEQLTDEEAKGVLLHEVLHMIYSHCLKKRRGIRQQQKWNIACFPPGTLIPGSNKPIEELKIGDVVYGTNGQKQAITDTMAREYNGKLFKIRGSGVLPFECTDEHPIRVITKKGGYPVEFNDQQLWKKPTELVVGEDYLVFPIPKGTNNLDTIELQPYLNRTKTKNHDQCHNVADCVKNGITLDEEFAWFMGLYAAEGSKTHKDGGVQFSLHIKETNYEEVITHIVHKLGYKVLVEKTPETKQMQVKLASTILSRFFVEHMGSGAKNKRIPEFILFHKNTKILEAFIDGLMSGDGCRVRENTVQLGTTSHILALQTQLAISRLGYFANVRKNIVKPRKFGEQDLPAGFLYVVDWTIPAKTTRNLNGKVINSTSIRWKTDGNYMFLPITEIIESDFSGKVYNLTTEDHTYTVSNVLVHNCDYGINWEIDEMDKKNIKLPHKIEIDGKPFNIFLDQKYRNMYVEQIYDLLPDEVANGGDGFDVHIDMPEDEGRQQELEDRILSAYEISKHEKEGKMPAGILRTIDNIRKSRVPWTRVFHRYVGTALAKEDYSYAQPNRRFIGQDLYMPTLLSYKLGTIAIAVDTSGSIGEKELTAMASELKKISALVSEVIVMSCDAKVHSFEIIRDMTNFQKAVKAIKGGGGTDFRPPFEMLKQKRITPEVMIYMTDGHGTFPVKKDVKYPTIWLMTTEIKAPFGTTIQMRI